jgi:hypothetical protein
MPKSEALHLQPSLEANMTLAVENLEMNDAVADLSKTPKKMPSAGPHARPELTNFEACPGAGALPSEQELGGDSDPGAG